MRARNSVPTPSMRSRSSSASALKRAKPGSGEFRQALRDALESEKEIAVSHGVLNYTLNDHLGFDRRGFVMLRIDKGSFQVSDGDARP